MPNGVFYRKIKNQSNVVYICQYYLHVKKNSRLVTCSSFSLCCSITEKNDPKKPDILEIQEFDCSEDGKIPW